MSPGAATPMVRATGLGYAFADGTVALADVEFDVGDSRVVGLLGENGAGKTTLLEILVGLRRPDVGSATVAGHPAGSRAARAAIGYLPSDCPAYPEMSVYEYLRFVAQLRAARTDLRGLSDRLGLGDLAGREVAALSRGQRQRVGLAAALVGEPALVVLDEPTTGLDPTQVAGVRDLLRDIASRSVMLLSTHALAEAEQLCDSVIVLARGRVVAAGSIDDVAGTEGLAAALTRPTCGEEAP